MKNIIMSLTIVMLSVSTAFAETIGRVEVRGWLVKDALVITAFDDPDIKGASCYITTYDRWNPFSEESGATSIGCRQTGPLSSRHGGPLSSVLKDNPDVYSRKLNIFFKHKKVSRYYDARRGVLVYLAYTRKFDGKDKSHSLSLIPVEEQ